MVGRHEYVKGKFNTVTYWENMYLLKKKAEVKINHDNTAEISLYTL